MNSHSDVQTMQITSSMFNIYATEFLVCLIANLISPTQSKFTKSSLTLNTHLARYPSYELTKSTPISNLSMRFPSLTPMCLHFGISCSRVGVKAVPTARLKTYKQHLSAHIGVQLQKTQQVFYTKCSKLSHSVVVINVSSLKHSRFMGYFSARAIQQRKSKFLTRYSLERKKE